MQEARRPLNVLSFISRLLFAIFVWVAIGGLAILSAVPYGGGSKFLLKVWGIFTIALPIWVILGLFKEDSNPVVGSESSPDCRCPYCDKVTPKAYGDCIWCHKNISTDQPTSSEKFR